MKNGYFVPEKDTYQHSSDITYACEKDYERRGEGWWGTSKCVNGTWSPEPVCKGKSFMMAYALCRGPHGHKTQIIIQKYNVHE